MKSKLILKLHILLFDCFTITHQHITILFYIDFEALIEIIQSLTSYHLFANF